MKGIISRVIRMDCTVYYEDGKVKEEQYYFSGIREKNWKKYDQNGDLVLT